MTDREPAALPPSPRRALAVMIAIVVAAAGIGLAVWAFAGRGGLHPAGTAKRGPIVFVQLKSGGADVRTGDLYRVEPDGSSLRRLTRSGDVSVDVAVSPDGSKVAFAATSGGSVDPWNIYVVNIDGSGLHPVTHAGYVKLAIGGAPAQLGAPSTFRRGVIDEWPSWTPDGRVRYFENTASNHRPGPGQGLWEVNADGTGAHRVITNWVPWTPAWSPDGSRVAWEGGPTGAAVLVANADGTGRRRITFDRGSTGLPAWSPDGSQIAFADQYELPHHPPGKGTLQVVNADGSGRRTVYSCIGCDVLWPAWSPDGSSIVFTLIEDGSHLEVVNVDGTDLHPLAGAPVGACCAAWAEGPAPR